MESFHLSMTQLKMFNGCFICNYVMKRPATDLEILYLHVQYK